MYFYIKKKNARSSSDALRMLKIKHGRGDTAEITQYKTNGGGGEEYRKKQISQAKEKMEFKPNKFPLCLFFLFMKIGQ